MKKAVLLLAVANLFMLLWWQGQLVPLLEVPGSSEREPLRASRQLRLDAIAVVPGAAPVPTTAVSKPR